MTSTVGWVDAANLTKLTRSETPSLFENNRRFHKFLTDGVDVEYQTIARELVDTVRGNVTIDWTQKESVKANLRRLVKRLLRKYGYPPEKQEKATVTVLEQAESLCKNWAA